MYNNDNNDNYNNDKIIIIVMIIIIIITILIMTMTSIIVMIKLILIDNDYSVKMIIIVIIFELDNYELGNNIIFKKIMIVTINNLCLSFLLLPFKLDETVTGHRSNGLTINIWPVIWINRYRWLDI